MENGRWLIKQGTEQPAQGLCVLPFASLPLSSCVLLLAFWLCVQLRVTCITSIVEYGEEPRNDTLDSYIDL